MVGTQDFNTYPFSDYSWADLTNLQQWAATKLGWSQQSWDDDTYIPGSLASLAEHDIPGTDTLKNELMYHLGFEGRSRYFVDDHVTAHYLATRILRYSVKTCVLRSFPHPS